MRHFSPSHSSSAALPGDALPGGEVRGRRVLIVGGGAQASIAARRLLAAGARLTVVAPDLRPEFYDWAYEGAVLLARRRFKSSDVVPHDLVVAGTGREAVDRLVVDAARKAGVPFTVLLDAAAGPAAHPRPRLVWPEDASRALGAP